MGCYCDGGYTGPDCSEKICKYGYDPLYYDDYQNVRYANFTYQIYTLANATFYGNYSLKFTDRTGEDWETDAIDINANCDAVTNALEALPNNVIPSGSVLCYQHRQASCENSPICDDTGLMYIGGINETNYDNGKPLQDYNPNTNGQARPFVPKFTLAFPKNPGNISQISINKYLDGSRATLYSDEKVSTLAWHIYSNGFTGEDDDLVPDECSGVLVKLLNTGSVRAVYNDDATPGTQSTTVSNGIYTTHSLVIDDASQVKLLKICLGDSDGDSTNNVEVYNWDYGNQHPNITSSYGTVTNYYQNPHLIKLVDATQDTDYSYTDPALTQYPITRLCSKTTAFLNTYSLVSNDYDGWCSNINPPGFYAVIYWDSGSSTFQVFTKAAQDYGTSTKFHVFTTTGYLKRVSPIVSAFSYQASDSSATKVNSYHSNIMLLSNFTRNSADTLNPDNLYGNVDCETASGSAHMVDCLNKGDYVMFLNVDTHSQHTETMYNPVYPNIYRVQKMAREDRVPASTDQFQQEKARHHLVLNTGVNAAYSDHHPASIYKFHPPSNAYNYVAQCSNRGICDKATGICQCFHGYTNDNCDTQNALAL